LGIGGHGINNKLEGLKYVKQFSPAFLEACDWIKNNLEEDVRIGGTI